MSLGGAYNIIGGGPVGLFKSRAGIVVVPFVWGTATAKNWGTSTSETWG
jgi:hypothetical protein